jgi:hypothetical protein
MKIGGGLDYRLNKHFSFRPVEVDYEDFFRYFRTNPFALMAGESLPFFTSPPPSSPETPPTVFSWQH